MVTTGLAPRGIHRIRDLLRISLVGCAVIGVLAQAEAAQTAGAAADTLKARLERRYEIVPLRDGVALVPRLQGSVRSIEIADGTIAIDGQEVTGQELRERLGPEADLVLELSYLTPAGRRALLDLPAAAAPSDRRSANPARQGTGRRGSEVRFGNSITVSAGEIITGDVVVLGGNAHIDGEVDGDAVVIGGALDLGPQAEVRGDATVVGGALRREPGAVVRGRVNEVAAGSGLGFRRFRAGVVPRGGGARPFARVVGLAGTLVRLGLLVLLAWAALAVARSHVDQVAARAAAEPMKAGLVGLLVEILFVPALVFLVVVLAVSIVGIPLIALVPVAIVGFFLLLVAGFTAVAGRLGARVQAGLGWATDSPYRAAALGTAAVLSPLLLARLIGLAGGPFALFAGALAVVGFCVEFAGWTVGLGATVLARFGRPLSVLSPASPEPPAQAT